ncbi:MAG: hypothetical protein KAT58_02775 [candidate division Zixibacteria bacterium]|nr:hypothetical protein [candidate division Zixibacteria bacterium]
MNAPICTCISYNRPDRGGNTPEVVLDYGKYFKTTRSQTVCVDACIAEPIERLWAAGIETGGCCCGHGLTIPTVMIKNPKDAELVFSVLAADKRKWHVMFWAGDEHG